MSLGERLRPAKPVKSIQWIDLSSERRELGRAAATGEAAALASLMTATLPPGHGASFSNSRPHVSFAVAQDLRTVRKARREPLRAAATDAPSVPREFVLAWHRKLHESAKSPDSHRPGDAIGNTWPAYFILILRFEEIVGWAAAPGVLLFPPPFKRRGIVIQILSHIFWRRARHWRGLLVNGPRHR